MGLPTEVDRRTTISVVPSAGIAWLLVYLNCPSKIRKKAWEECELGAFGNRSTDALIDALDVSEVVKSRPMP